MQGNTDMLAVVYNLYKHQVDSLGRRSNAVQGTCDDIAFSETRLGGRRVGCNMRHQYALHDVREVWVLLSHLCCIVLIELQHLDAYVRPYHTTRLLQLLYHIFGSINWDGKTDPISTQSFEAGQTNDLQA